MASTKQELNDLFGKMKGGARTETEGNLDQMIVAPAIAANDEAPPPAAPPPVAAPATVAPAVDPAANDRNFAPGAAQKDVDPFWAEAMLAKLRQRPDDQHANPSFIATDRMLSAIALDQLQRRLPENAGKLDVVDGKPVGGQAISVEEQMLNAVRDNPVALKATISAAAMSFASRHPKVEELPSLHDAWALASLREFLNGRPGSDDLSSPERAGIDRMLTEFAITQSRGPLENSVSIGEKMLESVRGMGPEVTLATMRAAVISHDARRAAEAEAAEAAAQAKAKSEAEAKAAADPQQEALKAAKVDSDPAVENANAVMGAALGAIVGAKASAMEHKPSDEVRALSFAPKGGTVMPGDDDIAETADRQPSHQDRGKYKIPPRPHMWPEFMNWPSERDMKMLRNPKVTDAQRDEFFAKMDKLPAYMAQRAVLLNKWFNEAGEGETFAKRRMKFRRNENNELNQKTTDPFKRITFAVLLDPLSHNPALMSTVQAWSNMRARTNDGGEVYANSNTVAVTKVSKESVALAIEEGMARGWKTFKLQGNPDFCKFAAEIAREKGIHAEITIRDGAFGLFPKKLTVMPMGPPPSQAAIDDIVKAGEALKAADAAQRDAAAARKSQAGGDQPLRVKDNGREVPLIDGPDDRKRVKERDDPGMDGPG